VGMLRITVDDTIRISATSARVHVSIKGQSSFSGALGARKASEVRELVTALTKHEISEDAVEVRGVRIENNQGRLGTKSQQVTISLTISATPEQLPAVLGVLADRSGASTNRLEWVYDEFEATIEATAEAMRKARRKAEVVAAAAGQRITGISQVTDTWSRPVTNLNMGGATRGSVSSGPAPELDLGVELNATAELSIHLSADFEMGE
jgi:hypothetical protein